MSSIEEGDLKAVQSFFLKSKLGYATFDNRKKAQLFDLLVHLTAKNDSVKAGLVFCMDQVDNSCQIALLICESVSDPHSPLSKVLARTYLISDLLHNSTITSQKCFWWARLT